MSERPRVPRPAGASRYGWFIGVAAVLLVAYVSINTARTHDVSSRGPTAGTRMHPFAVPLALGTLDGDANVATKPNQGSAGHRPACSVRGPQILNICQLWERGPVALAFLATRSGRCEQAIDRLDAVRRDYPKVQFAAVAIRGGREDLRRLVRARGWHFPVGYDRDGILANLYGIAVCPQLTLAARGGIVRRTLIGDVGEAQLRRALDALVAKR